MRRCRPASWSPRPAAASRPTAAALGGRTAAVVDQVDGSRLASVAFISASRSATGPAMVFSCGRITPSSAGAQLDGAEQPAGRLRRRRRHLVDVQRGLVGRPRTAPLGAPSESSALRRARRSPPASALRQDHRDGVVGVGGEQLLARRRIDDVVGRAEQPAERGGVDASGATRETARATGRRSTRPGLAAVTVTGRDRTQRGVRAIMRPVHATLRRLARTRWPSRYDVALLDLDGVVYVGPEAVPGARRRWPRRASAGMRLAFVTNNAARPPAAVAEHLTELGVAGRAGEVITRSQAAAHVSRRPAAGRRARCCVVGTTGLSTRCASAGSTPVDRRRGPGRRRRAGLLAGRRLAAARRGRRRDQPRRAVGRDQPRRDHAVAAGPAARQRRAGRRALRHATGADPVVTGKPDPAMHPESRPAHRRASGRSSSATGWTPTSRAPAGRVRRACWCSPA